MQTWVEHPIKQDLFKSVSVLIKNKSPLFIKISNKRDILKHWSVQMAEFWNLEYPELYIKGGGCGNIKKSIICLYQSKDVIELYIGISMSLYFF